MGKWTGFVVLVGCWLLDQAFPLHTGASLALAPWVIPAIISGASLLPSLFGGGPKKTIYEKGSPMYDYLTTGMLPGRGGSSSSSTSTTVSDMSSFPFFTEEFKGLGDMVRKVAENRLRNPTSLPAGFEATGVRNINNTYEGALQGVIDKLSTMGQLGSPGNPAAVAGSDRARAGDIASFRTNVPLLERQARTEDTNLAAQILESFGKGTRQKGKTTTTTKSSGGGGGPTFDPSGLLANEARNNQPSAFGQGFNSLLSTLGFLYGSGAFGNTGGASGKSTSTNWQPSWMGGGAIPGNTMPYPTPFALPFGS